MNLKIEFHRSDDHIFEAIVALIARGVKENEIRIKDIKYILIDYYPDVPFFDLEMFGKSEFGNVYENSLSVIREYNAAQNTAAKVGKRLFNRDFSEHIVLEDETKATLE